MMPRAVDASDGCSSFGIQQVSDEDARLTLDEPLPQAPSCTPATQSLWQKQLGSSLLHDDWKRDANVAAWTSLRWKLFEDELFARLVAIDTIVGQMQTIDGKIDILTLKLDEHLQRGIDGELSRSFGLAVDHNPENADNVTVDVAAVPPILDEDPAQILHLDKIRAMAHAASDDLIVKVTSSNEVGVQQTAAATSNGSFQKQSASFASCGETLLGRITGLTSAESEETDEVDVIQTKSYSEESPARHGQYCIRRSALWLFFEEPDSSRMAKIYSILKPVFVFVAFLFTGVQWCGLVDDKEIGIVIAEMVIDCIFMLEVAVRFMVCQSRLTFMKHPYNWIDILSAMPLFIRLPLMYAHDEHIHASIIVHSWDGGVYATLTEPVLLGIVPAIRLLKYLRHFQKFNLLLRAFKLAGEALDVLIFIYLLIITLFAGLLYIVEPRHSIENFPRALQLAVDMLTTLGYNGMAPHTALGKILVTVFVGVGMLYMAVPVGIIGKCFSEVWEDRDRYLLMCKTNTRFTQCGYAPADIPRIFELFDRDRDGMLSYKEFDAMVTRLSVGLNQARVQQLFSVLDVDGTGFIDDIEFIHGVFPTDFYNVYGMGLDEASKSRSGSRQASPCSNASISRSNRSGSRLSRISRYSIRRSVFDS